MCLVCCVLCTLCRVSGVLSCVYGKVNRPVSIVANTPRTRGTHESQAEKLRYTQTASRRTLARYNASSGDGVGGPEEGRLVLSSRELLASCTVPPQSSTLTPTCAAPSVTTTCETIAVLFSSKAVMHLASKQVHAKNRRANSGDHTEGWRAAPVGDVRERGL